MKLYKCETIAQFKIGMWLVEQGIEREDILTAELLGPNEVKITNPAGQYITGGAKLTGNLDSFKNALAAVNDPSLYEGSMAR